MTCHVIEWTDTTSALLIEDEGKPKYARYVELYLYDAAGMSIARHKVQAIWARRRSALEVFLALVRAVRTDHQENWTRADVLWLNSSSIISYFCQAILGETEEITAQAVAMELER